MRCVKTMIAMCPTIRTAPHASDRLRRFLSREAQRAVPWTNQSNCKVSLLLPSATAIMHNFTPKGGNFMMQV